jgi:hypothetical protein
MILQRMDLARAMRMSCAGVSARASTVLTLLLLLGIVGWAGLIETLFFVTVRK